jgi:N-acetylglutamate synthase-like GNAT family acetyltransferase
VDSRYKLRVATPQDADAVSELLQASYPKLMRPAYDEEAIAPALELMTRANQALLGSGTYYLAELATGRLVGCGGWSLERPGTRSVEPGIGHIRHFAVHPDCTRRGIGRTILELCDGAARAAGVRTFECYSSLNAEKFYRALGFVRIREIDMELRPLVVLRGVLMRRNLYDEQVP